MKSSKLVTLSLAGVGVLSIGALTLRSVLKSETKPVVSPAETTTPSKVDQRILRARQAIDKMPNSSDGYNQLAAAYMQKARETANFDYNASADDALTRSLAVEPDNYDALKLRSKLQLTYHRFADALETARRAQNVRVDDHDVWGQITDALVELGEYTAAVRAAQKMVDLRPDSSAYARVSYLRELHGDTNGAIQAMTAAVKAANPNDPEGVAWCRTQSAVLHRLRRLRAARSSLRITIWLYKERHGRSWLPATFKAPREFTSSSSQRLLLPTQPWRLGIYTRSLAEKMPRRPSINSLSRLNVRMLPWKDHTVTCSTTGWTTI